MLVNASTLLGHKSAEALAADIKGLVHARSVARWRSVSMARRSLYAGRTLVSGQDAPQQRKSFQSNGLEALFVAV